MERDMDLVLKILKYLENREDISVVQDMRISGYDDRVVAYHLRRMYEGGLLDAETITSSTTETRLINVLPFGLTWEGHEFLDSIKKEGVLQQVKSRLGGALSEVPYILLRELALSVGRAQIGL